MPKAIMTVKKESIEKAEDTVGYLVILFVLNSKNIKSI